MYIYESMTLQQRKHLHAAAGEWFRRVCLVKLEGTSELHWLHSSTLYYN